MIYYLTKILYKSTILIIKSVVNYIKIMWISFEKMYRNNLVLSLLIMHLLTPVFRMNIWETN